MSLVINDYLSRKLKALSLGTIILVVFIHSYNEEVKFASGEMTGGQSYFVLFVENFFSKGIARIAAPFFFAISGFLFYRSYDFTIRGVVDKLIKRFKSLVIPYLFWSVFGLIFIWLLQSIPWSKDFFTKELIIHYSFSKLLFTVLLDPIPYQLWFVRDLIMLVIFSPLIWYLTKSIRGVWLVMLVLLWTVAAKTFEFFSNEALLFFTLGCDLTLDKTELINQRLSKILSYCLSALWLLIVLLTTSLITFNRDIFVFNALNNLGILIGILSVWSLYDHVDHGQIAKYSILFGYSFFIFVFHEPMLTILKKGMFFLLGRTNFSSLLIYVVAPVITIGLSMLLSLILRRRTPRLYNLATGGR
ncbi:MAG: acyltransferase [Bacteroidetes bacterium]|nr:acyltransferase [Bacteroidota bacterium]